MVHVHCTYRVDWRPALMSIFILIGRNNKTRPEFCLQMKVFKNAEYGDQRVHVAWDSSHVPARVVRDVTVCIVLSAVSIFCAQESLERLMRDAQMNGIRQIPREPAPKPQATPSPPKEEGKEDYPYRCVCVPCFFFVCVCFSVLGRGGKSHVQQKCENARNCGGCLGFNFRYFMFFSCGLGREDTLPERKQETSLLIGQNEVQKLRF